MNYYQILNIKEDCTQDEIKKAYRGMALIYHPDKNKNPEALEKFKQVTEAYKTLIDPKKRGEYNLKFLHKPRNILNNKHGWKIQHVEKEYEPYYPTKPEEEMSPADYLRQRNEKQEPSFYEKEETPKKRVFDPEEIARNKYFTEEIKNGTFKIFDVEQTEDKITYKNAENKTAPNVHPHNSIKRNVKNMSSTERKPKLMYDDLPRDDSTILRK